MSTAKLAISAAALWLCLAAAPPAGAAIAIAEESRGGFTELVDNRRQHGYRHHRYGDHRRSHGHWRPHHDRPHYYGGHHRRHYYQRYDYPRYQYRRHDRHYGYPYRW